MFLFPTLFVSVAYCIMRIIFPLTLCTIAVKSAAPLDPCWLVCDEYSAVRNGMGFDLCGPSASRCDESTNLCTFLYWSRTEDGAEGLINGEMEPDLTPEEMASPLTCPRAREMVAHRLQAPSPQERQRRVVSVSPPAPAVYYPGVRGLRNIGNVCYFNTALQILTHMRPVRELLSNLQLVAEAGALEIEHGMPYAQQVNTQYLRTLVGLFAGMTDYEAGAQAQNPATILQNLVALGYDRFAHIGEPGDMPEALGSLFEATRGALESLQGAPAVGQLDPIRQIFSVDVLTRNTCGACHGGIGSAQQTNDLNINIHLQPYMQSLSLMEGLHMYFGEGMADVVCPSCVLHGVSSRQIVNAREIFVAQVLRVDQATGNRIDTPVTFPSGDELLDLTPFIQPGSASLANPLYRLVAISHHNGGHYYAELEHEGTWYRVDDGIVAPMAGPPAGPSVTATMFFYERVQAPSTAVTTTVASVSDGAPAGSTAGASTAAELDFSALIASFNQHQEPSSR